MIVRITMKDPDHYSTAKYLKLSKADQIAIAQYVEWGEYLTVEIDTKQHTARVLTVNEVNGGKS